MNTATDEGAVRHINQKFKRFFFFKLLLGTRQFRIALSLFGNESSFETIRMKINIIA